MSCPHCNSYSSCTIEAPVSHSCYPPCSSCLTEAAPEPTSTYEVMRPSQAEDGVWLHCLRAEVSPGRSGREEMRSALQQAIDEGKVGEVVTGTYLVHGPSGIIRSFQVSEHSSLYIEEA